MSSDSVLDIKPLGFQWEPPDPFLFCVHHDDRYPAGNEQMGPAASLGGRNLGEDFAGKDGWRMYHGTVVPGFPQHPHRGFETITIARHGLIDHSDSLGAAARFGQGDVQWMTAGGGVVHSEMFPLLDPNGPNRLEMFQIWLNLPASSKMVPAHFQMFWAHTIPAVTHKDPTGRETLIRVVAGRLGDVQAPPPPPHSWASRPDTDVAIWTIRMQPGARWTMPAAESWTRRTLYFFVGQSLKIDGRDIPPYSGVTLRATDQITLDNGDTGTELLLLQGRPIGEPVAQYGPFVMNTRAEIEQTFADYQRTQFGGWPWPSHAPVHPRDAGRFARHADGKIEKAE